MMITTRRKSRIEFVQKKGPSEKTRGFDPTRGKRSKDILRYEKEISTITTKLMYKYTKKLILDREVV